jgi:alkylation response protein AidB-like acyl-CoA dehydrogenase
MFALVRTTRAERKQQGISFILLEMTSPGLTIRPIANLAGEEEFCEVFFDDVKVPIANVIGGLDNGWTVAKALLGHERVWLGSPGLCTRALGLARALLAARPHDEALFDAYAACAADLHDLTCLYRQTCASIAGGTEPGVEVSMLKVIQTELLQRITELNVELGGGDALIDGDSTVGDEVTDYGWQFFMARPGTIFAGANEIQRNVLAKAVLGLK